MKGYIKYVDEMPKHVFKMDWSKGQMLSFEKLHLLFGDKCTATTKLDTTFLEWFVDTYRSLLAKGFEVVLEEDSSTSVTPATTDQSNTENNELAELLEDPEVRSEVANELTKPNKCIVESSSLHVGRTQEEVQTHLKAERHNSRANIMKESAAMKTNKTGPDTVKSLPRPGNVMTGDDLAKTLKGNIQSKNSSSFILTKEGEAAQAIPSSKEEQTKSNAQMAELSGRARVHMPEATDPNSKVLMGGTSPQSQVEEVPGQPSQPGYKQQVVSGARKNKNFVGYATEGSSKEIKPEDIARNKDEKESMRFIEICKDTTVLKVARIYCDNLGKQKLIDRIDMRLRQLPPR